MEIYMFKYHFISDTGEDEDNNENILRRGEDLSVLLQRSGKTLRVANLYSEKSVYMAIVVRLVNSSHLITKNDWHLISLYGIAVGSNRKEEHLIS